jgi:hypothetical protein
MLPHVLQTLPACLPAALLLSQVRGRLTVQEGRNVQYSGIMHAARTIAKEVGWDEWIDWRPDEQWECAALPCVARACMCVLPTQPTGNGRLAMAPHSSLTLPHSPHSPSLTLQEGALAFYKGWLPSVIGVVPYVGLNFCVYETLKHALLAHYDLRDERDLSVAARLACGAAAGTTGQTVAYPFDVARRRLQVRLGARIGVCGGRGPP